MGYGGFKTPPAQTETKTEDESGELAVLDEVAQVEQRHPSPAQTKTTKKKKTVGWGGVKTCLAENETKKQGQD